MNCFMNQESFESQYQSNQSNAYYFDCNNNSSNNNFSLNCNSQQQFNGYNNYEFQPSNTHITYQQSISPYNQNIQSMSSNQFYQNENYQFQQNQTNNFSNENLVQFNNNSMYPSYQNQQVSATTTDNFLNFSNAIEDNQIQMIDNQDYHPTDFCSSFVKQESQMKYEMNSNSFLQQNAYYTPLCFQGINAQTSSLDSYNASQSPKFSENQQTQEEQLYSQKALKVKTIPAKEDTFVASSNSASLNLRESEERKIVLKVNKKQISKKIFFTKQYDEIKKEYQEDQIYHKKVKNNNKFFFKRFINLIKNYHPRLLEKYCTKFGISIEDLKNNLNADKIESVKEVKDLWQCNKGNQKKVGRIFHDYCIKFLNSSNELKLAIQSKKPIEEKLLYIMSIRKIVKKLLAKQHY